jgi:hypothetical protein
MANVCKFKETYGHTSVIAVTAKHMFGPGLDFWKPVNEVVMCMVVHALEHIAAMVTMKELMLHLQ